ncbi:hypothetical protein PPL_11235 [Heterostelium album PN500]|uniref:Uncharacterized protein n=1 Tax=Heterostelium pallidum (strain ATCC 26659 / Pp 5 / PN500) TaxID=670386 RepID=D3BTX5_HETP5|nr:hypothetical protein PPL_11235 [Heterostelium album PN500]EFA75161.1 hypothetical protein PPL_11235 [Heterostelium album PN500]|eukprot:XP_020427295.1 hypothetical protein PPL_11235 [Heterostelium album PN500]
MFFIKKEIVTLLLMMLAILMMASMFTVQYEIKYKEVYFINGTKVVHINDQNIYNFGIEIDDKVNGIDDDNFYSLKVWPRGLLLFSAILSLRTISIFFLVTTILVGLIYLKGQNTTSPRAPLIFIILFNMSFLFNFISVVIIGNLTEALRRPIKNTEHTCIENNSYVRQCQTLSGSFSSAKYESYDWGFRYGWYIGLGAMLAYIILEIPIVLLLRNSTVEPKSTAPPFLEKYGSQEELTPKEDGKNNNIIVDSTKSIC